MQVPDDRRSLLDRVRSVETIERYVALAARRDLDVTIAVIELDDIQQLIQDHGRSVVDGLLRGFGERLAAAFRAEDVPARWSQERFVVGLFGASAEESVPSLERLAEEARLERSAGANGEALDVTFSAGLASFPEHGTGLDEVLDAADRALLRARETGRGRIAVAGDDDLRA